MNYLQEMTVNEIELAFQAEAVMQEMEQFDVTTHHTLHAGVYTRTITLSPGEAIVGALIKIPTTLLITGDMKLTIGDEIHHIEGFKAIPAQQNRKQIMVALDYTVITMVFKTEAKTVDEAEMEFTDQYKQLASRLENAINHINITGV